MALTPGTRLGPYEIVSAIGAGGMGEVYRAHDTRLGREVAVKILPAELAEDPGRRERFEREAHIVASLNHPNILALYDVGSDQGVAYLVTEVVEGDSLRNAQLSRRAVLDVAAQIADGLGAAHAAGITHRDLKPDNIIVTRDGRAKLLDFGVAKMSAPGGVAAATLASTGLGVIVGTAGYMAPEQIRGTSVDHRADIFAFGIVLHEMLSGARPFGGETAADVIGAILSKDAPELPADVPAGVRQVVQRCLEKKPEGRFQSANDLAFALRQLTGSSIAVVPEPARVGARSWPRVAVGGGIAASLVVLGAALTVRWSTETFDAAIDPIQLTRVSADRLRETGPAFSPDGRSIAYIRAGAGANELLVQSQEAFAPLELVRTPLPVTNPVWSPDGNRICYSSVNRDFMCVGAAGGMPQRVLTDAFQPQFTPDGRALVFVRVADGGPRLFRSEPPGAEPRRIGDVPGDTAALSSLSPSAVQKLAFANTTSYRFSPDGRRIAYSDPTGLLIVATVGGQSIRALASSDIGPYVCWSADGEWLWYSAKRRLHKLPSQGGEAVAMPGPTFVLHDCSPDGRWVVGRGARGFVLLSTDGTQHHEIATNADYPPSNLTQFGEGGRVLYMLNQNRQAIDVLAVPDGARLRSIPFDVPAGDMIQHFSIDASSTRVLLTIGGERYDVWMAEGFARPATSWRRWFRHWEAPS